jgi:hypothetical protein
MVSWFFGSTFIRPSTSMPKPSVMVTSARMIFLGFCSSVIVVVDFLITDLACQVSEFSVCLTT